MLLAGGNMKLVVNCKDKAQNGVYECTILNKLSENDTYMGEDCIDVGLKTDYRYTIDQIQNLKDKTSDLEGHEKKLREELGFVKAKLYELDFNDEEVKEQLAQWDREGLTKARLDTLLKKSCPLHLFWINQLQNKGSVKSASESMFMFVRGLVEELSRYHFGLPKNSSKHKYGNVIVEYDLFNDPNDNKAIAEFATSAGMFKIDMKPYFSELFSGKTVEEIRSIVYTREGISAVIESIYEHINKEFSKKMEESKMELIELERQKKTLENSISKLKSSLNEADTEFKKGVSGGLFNGKENKLMSREESNRRFRKNSGQYNLNIKQKKLELNPIPLIDFDKMYNFFGSWKFKIDSDDVLVCINNEPGKANPNINSEDFTKREKYLEKGDTIYTYDTNMMNFTKKIYKTDDLKTIFAFAKSYRVKNAQDIYEIERKIIEIVNVKINNVSKKLSQEWLNPNQKKKKKKLLKSPAFEHMLHAYYNAYVREHTYAKNFPGIEFIRLLYSDNNIMSNIFMLRKKQDKKYLLDDENRKCAKSPDCMYSCALQDALNNWESSSKEEVIKLFIRSFFKGNSCSNSLLPKEHLYKDKEGPKVGKTCGTRDSCGSCTENGLKSFCFRMKCKCHKGLQGQEFLDSLGSDGENIPKVMGWIPQQTLQQS